MSSAEEKQLVCEEAFLHTNGLFILVLRSHPFGEMPKLERDPPWLPSQEMSFIRESSLSLVQAG